jgi:hypothetical protein
MDTEYLNPLKCFERSWFVLILVIWNTIENHWQFQVLPHYNVLMGYDLMGTRDFPEEERVPQ